MRNANNSLIPLVLAAFFFYETRLLGQMLDGGSLCRAYFTSVEPFTVIDVAVEDEHVMTNTQVSGVLSGQETVKIKQRLSIDYEGSEVRYVRQLEVFRVDVSDSMELIGDTVECCCYHKGMGMKMLLIGSNTTPVSTSEMTFEEFCQRNSIPYFNAAGLGVFFLQKGNTWFDQIAIASHKMDGIKFAQQSNSLLTFRGDAPRISNEPASYMEVTFDLERRIPIRFFRERKTPSDVPDYFRSSVDYVKKHDAYFPSLATIKSGLRTSDRFGKTIDRESNQTIKYTWLGISKDEVEFVDPNQLMIDKATSLEFLHVDKSTKLENE